ncbi:MAG: C4-dicarboxylate ABC transporter substrate-binding protein [Rhodobacteraceae bacterium]|nr:C4-dicarboxylate ABC transporter substrate-binding protein [Paracoccaceae bacterium]MBR9823588.1 C4-dicarboxylate ABC transporter substrate-binding protein [Paracoccaceae bacterium]
MNHIKRAATALSLLCAATVAQAETTLLFGEAGPDRGPRPEAIKWYADEVAARSDGELKIDIQWGGALFKSSAAMQSIGSGVADLGTIISVYYPQEMIGLGIADLPIRNADLWVSMRATDELMRTNEAIRDDLASKDLVYLGVWTTSQVNIACKGRTIRSISDIEGVKVRGVGAYGKVFGDLGATSINMNTYEAYQGLDTGLLDCTQGYSYLMASLKLEEVVDSYTLLDWGQVGGLGLFMNKFTFDSLSEEEQKVLLEAGEEMSDEFGEILTRVNDEAIQTLTDAGVEITTLPEEERAVLIENGLKYIDEWVTTADGAGLPGEEILQEYRDLIAKWTTVRDEKGYPWAPKE